MSIEKVIRDARRKVEHERSQWVGETQVIFTLETNSIGSTTTEILSFGSTFEGKPFLSWHVELLDGALQPGSYPIVNVFVAEWDSTKLATDLYVYRGASFGIQVSSSVTYHLGFLVSLVGKSYKASVR